MTRRVRLSGTLYHPSIPAGAKRITRPTKYGNPFPASIGLGNALRLYAGWLTGDPGTVALARLLGCRLNLSGPDLLAAARVELAGYDLACWCPPGAPCHGDLLLTALATPSPAVLTTAVR